MQTSPAFGQADLTNCERELIHLAGSVQPHGVLLVVDEARHILQASANCGPILGRPAEALLGEPLARSGAIWRQPLHGLRWSRTSIGMRR
jgi:two-component system, chemotaxis family, sensor kinase Cph1